MPADDPGHARMIIVGDPDDGPDTGKLLNHIDNLDRGVLVVHPVPGTTGLPDLALAVLAALGKDLDARPKHHPRRWWDLARAWTVGHRIDHLVVDRAHTLPANLVHHLTGLAATAQATVWFIDAHAPGAAPALAALGATETASVGHLHRLAETARSRPPHPNTSAGQIPAMSMPCAGFLTFRYACERHLPAAHVRDVDAAWRAAFGATQSWLMRTAPYDRLSRPPIGQLRAALPAIAATLSARLAAVLYTAVNQSTALLRLRATEAALFRHGLLLHHQPHRAGGHEHLLHCPLTPIAAATINRTVSTHAAAAAILHLIYPLTSAGRWYHGEPRSWRVGNLRADGSLLLTSHGRIPIPSEAQPAVRAHLHALQDAGQAAADSPLIDEQRHSQVTLAEQVLAPLKLTPRPGTPEATAKCKVADYLSSWMGAGSLVDACVVTGIPRI